MTNLKKTIAALAAGASMLVFAGGIAAAAAPKLPFPVSDIATVANCSSSTVVNVPNNDNKLYRGNNTKFVLGTKANTIILGNQNCVQVAQNGNVNVTGNQNYVTAFKSNLSIAGKANRFVSNGGHNNLSGSWLTCTLQPSDNAAGCLQ